MHIFIPSSSLKKPSPLLIIDDNECQQQNSHNAGNVHESSCTISVVQYEKFCLVNRSIQVQCASRNVVHHNWITSHQCLKPMTDKHASVTVTELLYNLHCVLVKIQDNVKDVQCPRLKCIPLKHAYVLTFLSCGQQMTT
jgi:hypothetical protein